MELIEQIQRLAQKEDKLAVLWLYGSRAREDNHPGSDYDLAVGFIDRLEDPLERRLRPELLAETWKSELGLPEKALSIVDIGLVPIPLGIAILSEGKLLVDRHPQIRLTLESRILSRWELDYQYHQQHYGTL